MEQTRAEQIRQFILENLQAHPVDIAEITAKHFSVTKKTVLWHLRKLESQKSIGREQENKRNSYHLLPIVEQIFSLHLVDLQEDIVWREQIRPVIGDFPDNVLSIWSYGISEMLNNAIDHSQGNQVSLTVRRYIPFTEVIISDNGMGIFRKIQEVFKLNDEHHARLELAKGKVTTAPERHSGEGVFFSSRVFDEYAIISCGICFFHEHNKPEDWIIEQNSTETGTTVIMRLANNSERKIKNIFEQYTSQEGYSFDKTVVPVALAQYGNEFLVSRSQAKRLVSGLDRFRVIILDFAGIDQIGQGFADEVFRVFKNKNPHIHIIPANSNTDISGMIAHVLSACGSGA